MFIQKRLLFVNAKVSLPNSDRKIMTYLMRLVQTIDRYIYYISNNGSQGINCTLRADYDCHIRLFQKTILNAINKFEDIKSVSDVSSYMHHRNVRPVEIIVNVIAKLLILRRVYQLGLPYGSLWRTLHLNLHLYPYNV